MKQNHPRRIALAATTGLLVVATLFVSSAMATPTSSDNHTICHATASASNPFVVITIDPEGVYNGHLGSSQNHQSSEDIIPPFTYNGTVYSQNWGAEGQAIFNNECEMPDSSSSSSTSSTSGTNTTEIPFFPSWSVLALGVSGAIVGSLVMLRRRL